MIGLESRVVPTLFKWETLSREELFKGAGSFHIHCKTMKELYRSEICHCRRQCKIFASGVNFSNFTNFLVFLSPTLFKYDESKGVKFLAWKSSGVKFLTNLMSGVVVYGRPRYPEGTKLSTKLCYPKTLHWYKNTSRAITLPSWRVIRQNLAIFGYSWAFFFTFFGYHSHKYAYFWNPSHRHNPKTYTELFWSSFEHCHSPMMCTGGVQNGPLGPKKDKHVPMWPKKAPNGSKGSK